MKKIITGAAIVGILTTNVFALSSEDSVELQAQWEVSQSKVHAGLEITVGTYTSIVNQEIWNENVQKVCSTDIESLTLDAVRSTGNYDRYYQTNPRSDKGKALNVKGWQDEYLPMCKQYVSNYVGQELEFSLNDSSGVSSRYSTAQYCTNYSSYLRHVQKDQDLSLAFGTFVSRLPVEKLDIITRISENKTEIQAHALLTYLSKTKRVSVNAQDKVVFSTMPFIDFYFNKNNKSFKSGIGGNDLRLKEFLAAVISKNFYKADKILEKHMKQSRKIVKKAQFICEKTDIYKGE